MTAESTTEFIRVCAVADIPPGGVVRAEIDDTAIALVHTEDGGFYAIYDECSHAEVPLSEGDVWDCSIECWLHGSRFDLKTGQPVGPPATEPVPVYPVEVRDGDLFVRLMPDGGVTAQ